MCVWLKKATAFCLCLLILWGNGGMAAAVEAPVSLEQTQEDSVTAPEPSTEPEDPEGEPSEPGTEPETPEEEPSEPDTEPEDPEEEPSEPGTDETEPPVVGGTPETGGGTETPDGEINAYTVTLEDRVIKDGETLSLTTVSSAFAGSDILEEGYYGIGTEWYGTDVPASHWSAEAVGFTASRELFAGTSATTFSPDAAMSRAMIVTVLARFEGVDTTTGDTWYEAGRQWAMTNSVSDGANMDQVLTREQLATMLWRYAGSPSATADLNKYTDAASISDWAVQAMSWAVEQGIIGGTTSTTLSPQGQATRAQAAVMLMRFCELDK